MKGMEKKFFFSGTSGTCRIICVPLHIITSSDQTSHDKLLSKGQEKEATFKWGNHDGKSVVNEIGKIYEKVVFWRKNNFLLPTGTAGKRYFCETIRLIPSIIDNSSLKEASMQAIMVMPSLLLQKPSRSKDHNAALKRRMDLWENGDIKELMKESMTIQRNLKSVNGIKSIEEVSKQFVDKMSKGNINGTKSY